MLIAAALLWIPVECQLGGLLFLPSGQRRLKPSLRQPPHHARDRIDLVAQRGSINDSPVARSHFLGNPVNPQSIDLIPLS
jgi:hypothetical protein